MIICIRKRQFCRKTRINIELCRIAMFFFLKCYFNISLVNLVFNNHGVVPEVTGFVLGTQLYQATDFDLVVAQLPFRIFGW